VGTATAKDKYSGALEVRLARSRRMVAFVVVSTGATVALVAAMPLPIAASILLATFASCLGLHALGRALVPRRLWLDHSGAVSVDGVAGALRPGSFVAPWLAIVRWRPARAWIDRTLPVLPDMLPAGAFRELRVLLKWGQTTKSAF
jgi:hypothetical protein